MEELFVSCTPGLEPALLTEIEALGLQGIADEGGVSTSGPDGTCERLNLWLRTASRVLVRVGKVTRVHELENLPLHRYAKPGDALTITADGDRASEWQAEAQKLWGQGGRGQPLEVMLRSEKGVCTVSIDSSGALLYLRGYRQELGKAPLRETLAAGLLELAGYDGTRPLWDVMCGSGTFLIEAAWRAKNVCPGAMRGFAFQRWPLHDKARFEKMKEAPTRPVPTIIGSDLNAGALGVSRRNAKRAGVLHHLGLERLDVAKLQMKPHLEPGLVIANLPYGKRVGQSLDLEPLYKDVGKTLLREFAGWNYGLLMMEGEELLGFEPQVVQDVSNGGLGCRFLTGTVPENG